MKYNFLLFTFMLLGATNISHSQCSITLDDYLRICDYESETSISLGQSLQVSGGAEPYSYYWSCLWEPFPGSSLALDEYDFLDDPTAMNPNLVDSVLGDTLVFTLTVTDAEENTCTASISVITSCFITTLGGGCGSAGIQPGESVMLCTETVPCIEPGTYLWTPATGLDNPTSPNPLASPEESTIYTCEITDALGCSTTTQFSVVVQTVGVNEKNSDLLNIFPNPAGNVLQISSGYQSVFHAAIKDNMGRTVLSRQLNNAPSVLNIESLSPGSYLCEITLTSGVVVIKRFMKK